MKLTLLDTETGEESTESEEEWSAYQWEDGNWSCDCNRYQYFDVEEPHDSGICFGAKRFLVIAFEKESPDEDDTSLEALNFDYPEELKRKFGLPV